MVNCFAWRVLFDNYGWSCLLRSALSQVLVAVKSLGYSSQALHLVTTVQKQLEATSIYIYNYIYIKVVGVGHKTMTKHIV